MYLCSVSAGNQIGALPKLRRRSQFAPRQFGRNSKRGKSRRTGYSVREKQKKILFLEKMPVVMTNRLTTHSLNATIWGAFEFKSADYDYLVAWWL